MADFDIPLVDIRRVARTLSGGRIGWPTRLVYVWGFDLVVPSFYPLTGSIVSNPGSPFAGCIALRPLPVSLGETH